MEGSSSKSVAKTTAILQAGKHDEQALWSLWAKWPQKLDGVQPYHPLPCHMMDTVCVVEKLWQECLPTAWKQRLADELVLALPEVQHWLMFLAGAHDVGKASPGFQTQLHGESIVQVQALLRRAGLPDKHLPWVPHALVSALALKAYYLQNPAIDGEVVGTTMMIIGGHHGFFPSSETLRDPQHMEGKGRMPWEGMRLHLLNWLAMMFAIPAQLLPERLPQSTALRIAGLISVADWIASSATDFRYAVADVANPAPIDPDAYLKTARTQAERALTRIGWTGWVAPAAPATFASLFPEWAPRDLQQTVSDIAPELSSPAMVIIEAPMGEGKTEAAMYLADHWRVADGGRGMFFALPTQATSASMFLRVRDFLEKRFPQDCINLNLLHGHASLSEALEELRARSHWLLEAQPIYDAAAATDTARGAVIATEWFASGNRALLAPFGVGTVDQGLLAALSVKHGFVRHLGLSTKTVIIDEVHAYDIYMTTLMERLIEWLGAHATPVILLSATLPAARRERLLSKYAKGAGWSAQMPVDTQEAYPRISWATATTSGQRAIIPTRHTTVQLEHLERKATNVEDAEGISSLLEGALREGGCAAVICNTVDRAQQIFQALQAYFPDRSAMELDLFHARFPYDMRAEIEKRVLLRYGKDGPRPERAILVATQVIEQSLDLDFDVMITDLAPVDLVLQRLGRLQRHERQRPQPLKTPTCYLFMPSQEDGYPAFTKADDYIYDSHILLRSWLALRHQTQLAIPGAIESLVEAVYSNETAPADLSPVLLRFWEETRMKMKQAQAAEENSAKQRYIHDPNTDARLDIVMGTTLEENRPEIHPAHQALTRNSEPSVSVICLSQTHDQIHLRPGGAVVDMNAKPDPATIRDLLLRSVTLSQRDVVAQLMHAPQPKHWQDIALLRHCRPLYFDAAGKTQVGARVLRLDADLGIVFERNSAAK